jgi:glycosyltransferase involved in cell wall biosynthesis
MGSAKKVIMVGPFPKGDSFRGISAVLAALYEVGSFGSYRVEYVATSHRGGKLLKILALGRGLLVFAKHLSSRNSKIVHVHAADFRSFFRKALFVVLGKLFNKRVILHVHGAQFPAFYSGASRIGRAAITRVLEAADLVIALSDSWREYLQTICGNQRIRVLYNPVNGSPYERIKQSKRINANTMNVLYMTMLYARKGIYDLLDVVPDVLRRIPCARFHICGEGELESCKKICADKGISEAVTFHGWIGGERKIEMLQQADVFVLPSHYEGLPVCLIEAMFAGLPIVATAVGGVPDIMKDNQNGYLIPVGDKQALAEKIAALLGDVALRTRIGEHNRAEAFRTFEANVVVRRLCNLYDEALTLASAH